MRLENETETIKKAINGDGEALGIISNHLQRMAKEWGSDHARIEVQRFVIISIAFLHNDQLDGFKMQLYEMIQR